MKTTIIAKRITGTKNGKDYDFISSRIIVDGNWMECVFTKSVAITPSKEGKYTVEVEEGKYNVNTKGEYPKCFITELVSINPVKAKAE